MSAQSGFWAGVYPSCRGYGRFSCIVQFDYDKQQEKPITLARELRMPEKSPSLYKPAPLSGQIEIPSQDLIRIFKLGDTSVYETCLSQEEADGIYSNVLAIFEFFESPTSQVLSNFGDLREYTAHVAYSEKGIVTMFMTLQTVSANAELEKWVFLTIAEASYKKPETKEGYTLKPLFGISGQLENELDFHPEDCVCRTSGADNDALLRAETDDDFYAFLLYGQAALSTMIENRDVDMKALAKHVKKSLIPTAHIFYDDLRAGLSPRPPKEESHHHITFTESATSDQAAPSPSPVHETDFPILEEQDITMALRSLENIFLIGNKTLYPPLTADQTDEILEHASNALDFSEAPFKEDFFGEHTLDLESAKIYSKTSLAGEFIHIIQYQGVTSIEGEGSRIVIVIGDNPPSDDRTLTPTPYFTLCAKVFGKEVAIEDCRCLKITESNQFEVIVATSHYDFYQAMCYGDAAFLGLVGALSTHVGDYGRCLDPEFEEGAKLRYLELLQRTAQSLSADIIGATTLSLEEDPQGNYDDDEGTAFILNGGIPSPNIH